MTIQLTESSLPSAYEVVQPDEELAKMASVLHGVIGGRILRHLAN